MSTKRAHKLIDNQVRFGGNMKLVRDEEELLEVRDYLQEMEKDPTFTTVSAYRADAVRWPKHRISFIENHLNYLRTHPQISTNDYLINLRIQLRVR